MGPYAAHQPCRQVSKTSHARGSTEAAWILFNLWARSVESRTAVLHTAGPGALPGGSISIFIFKRGEVEGFEPWARCSQPWEHQKAGATPATATNFVFNRKPGSPDSGLITLTTRSITGACHHFSNKDPVPDRGR